jgi:biotin carboxylase
VSRPLLLLVDSSWEDYRDYLLESIAREYRIWLFSSHEPTWERRSIVGSTLVDTLDAGATLAAARDLAARTRIDGVYCYDEARILVAARVAQLLGLPGGDPNAIYRCRDKRATRAALAEAGVPQPESIVAEDPAAARAAAARVGFPLVLKPRALAASEGVIRVDSAAELDAAFAFARAKTLPEAPDFNDAVLVEEYVDGLEVSVDALCFRGRVASVFVARKLLGFEPSFAEVGHVVDGADPLLHDPELTEVVAAALRAVGLRDGWAHVEVKLSAAGPKVIEINGRQGGDLIPYLGLRATGIDAGLAGAAVACGREPDLRPRRARVAGIRFCYPRQDGVVERVAVDRAALPPQVDRVRVLAEPGDELRLPPRSHLHARCAYCTSLAASVEECLEALDAAAAAVEAVPAAPLPA